MDPFEVTKEKLTIPRNADFYAVLGVTNPEGWTGEELASLYRRTCREHHPDKYPDSQEHAQQFRRLQDAYAVVGNPQRRAIYDRWLASGLTNLVSLSQWEGHPTVCHWRAELPEPKVIEGAEELKEEPRQTQWGEIIRQQEKPDQEELKKLFRTYKI